MRDEKISIGNVGCENGAAYVDVRNGDSTIRVGQGLWSAGGETPVRVEIDRIEFFGHDVAELDAGHTARLWISPLAAAGRLERGLQLMPSAPS